MEQTELDLDIISDPRTIPINGRCTLKKDSGLLVVYVAGLPVYSWACRDKMTESYAMVNLVQHGYANQNDVARAFGYSVRTLRRKQRNFDSQGMVGLHSSGGRPQGSKSTPNPGKRIAKALRRKGFTMRDIAHRLGVGIATVSRWTKNPEKPLDEDIMNEYKDVEISPLGNTDTSFDKEPVNRGHDRMLAMAGLL